MNIKTFHGNIVSERYLQNAIDTIEKEADGADDVLTAPTCWRR